MDVAIAVSLIALGLAVMAVPWLGPAAVVGAVAIAGIALGRAGRATPRGVTSGQLPWT